MTDKDVVLAALGAERLTLAELQRKAGLPIERVRVALIQLEHAKTLRRHPSIEPWRQTWERAR